MNNLIGQSLGRYHIIEKLGEGGMAIVYKAFDTHLECEVAVKVIRTDQLAPAVVEHTMKRFEREAKEVAKLNHPNIVRVMDYGEQDGIPYLVMPYQHGGTLKQFLGKPMPCQKAATLLLPIAKALEYAHQHKMIHRDVKPSNILITDSGEVMLTDFGIVKMLDVKDGNTLTGTGVGLGTPEYMAPEQWLGEFSSAVDQYSLGVVFYELITGRKPYSADTPAAVLLKQANEALPRPKSIVAGIPDEAEKVLFKSLAKKPDDRYENMSELVNALSKLERTTENNILKKSYQKSSDLQISIEDYATSDSCNATEGFMTHTQNSSSIKQGKRSNLSGKYWGLVLGGIVLLIIAFGYFDGWFSQIFKIKSRPVSSNNEATETTLGIGSTKVSEIDGMTMVYVPAGEFIMGSPEGVGEPDEHPQHKVNMKAYWIDQTEVTFNMYEECVNKGFCSGITDYYYFYNSAFYEYPATSINWFQAKSYCEWVGRKLPTEAQWEKAARGINGQTYPWGETMPDSSLVNFSGSGDSIISPVSRLVKGSSPYQAMDMAGNVAEWVSDWYADYTADRQFNPVGPVSGENKILRGGTFVNSENYIRSAFRLETKPTIHNKTTGFRCAMDAD